MARLSRGILWYRLKDLVHEYIAKPDGNVGMSVVRGAFLGSRTNLSSEVYCVRLVNRRSGGPGKCFRPERGVQSDRPRVPSESKPQFLAAAMYPTMSNTLCQNSISHSKDVCSVLEPLRLFTDQTPKKVCVYNQPAFAARATRFGIDSLSTYAECQWRTDLRLGGP
jgi:hypothetical protein